MNLRLLLPLALLALLALASGCSGDRTSRALNIESGEMATRLDGIDARAQALADLADQVRVADVAGGSAGALADRLQTEVDLLQPARSQLRATLQSLSLFPEENSTLELSRLKSDAESLGAEAANLRERSSSLAAIAADAHAAGLTADADEVEASAAAFREDADRVQATAEALAARADRLAGSLGLRP